MDTTKHPQPARAPEPRPAAQGGTVVPALRAGMLRRLPRCPATAMALENITAKGGSAT